MMLDSSFFNKSTVHVMPIAPERIAHTWRVMLPERFMSPNSFLLLSM